MNKEIIKARIKVVFGTLQSAIKYITSKENARARELVVFGEQFWRPYCDVEDFSQAILKVLRAPAEKVAYEVAFGASIGGAGGKTGLRIVGAA